MDDQEERDKLPWLARNDDTFAWGRWFFLTLPGMFLFPLLIAVFMFPGLLIILYTLIAGVAFALQVVAIQTRHGRVFLAAQLAVLALLGLFWILPQPEV